MFSRRVAALAAVIIALGGTIAVTKPTSLLSQTIAQVPADRQAPNGPGWLKDLNLSADQVQKIQTIRSQYKEKITQQRQSMRQSMQELRELMASNVPAEEVRQKYNQTKALRQQLADTQFNSMLAMREVLNSEQRRKFADRMQRHRDNFRNRMRDNSDQQR